MTVGARPSTVASAPLGGTWTDCRLCGSRLIYDRERFNRKDNLKIGLCAECQGRPEAARFGVVQPAGATAAGPARPVMPPPGPRAFNGAEKALIRACVKNYMPAAQLLDILNQRLVADVGAVAVPFTMEQLWEEAKGVLELSHSQDWTGLRQVIAKARKSGLLATITPQLIDDFCVVFQLSAAQRMQLHDVVKNAQEGR